METGHLGFEDPGVGPKKEVTDTDTEQTSRSRQK